MKMYSIYNLLIFFKLQQERKYAVIEKIISIINSNDYTDAESRDYIYGLLRESGMVEEGYESEENGEVESSDGSWAHVQEFEIKIQDRIYRITYYLN